MQTIIDLILSAFKRAGDPVVAPSPANATPKGWDGYLAVREGYTLVPVPRGSPSGPRRLHAFEDVTSFGAFLLRHFSPATTEILGNRDTGIAAVSGAIHGRDVVTCNLAKTSVWDTWSAALETRHDQRGLYRLLRAHQKYIVGDAGALLSGLKSLEVLGTSEVKGNLTDQGVYEFVGVAQGTTLKGRLPTDFKVAFHVYRGNERLPTPAHLVVDVEVVPEIVPGVAPRFRLEAHNWEEVQDAAFKDELAKLDMQINGAVESEVQDSLAKTPARRERRPEERYLVGIGKLSLTDTWA